MSSIVVTGGAGFIGSHIVDLFVRDGHQVIVIDNLSTGLESNLPKGVKLLKCDIRSPEAQSALVTAPPDILVHAAAQISVRVSMSDPAEDADVNVVGFLNLLQGFLEKTFPFVVFISTGGAIYGEQEKFPADEDHPIAPTSAYGLAKRVDELYLDLFARQFGLKYASLRLGNVYGPRQNPHGEAGVVAIFMERLLRGEVPVINGTGEQTRDFVYVGDVAAAVHKVASDRVEGIYNIGTGTETSVNSLYSHIARATGSASTPKHGEAKAGEQMRSCIDHGKAKKRFGWKPEFDISRGIQETAAWFKSQVKS